MRIYNYATAIARGGYKRTHAQEAIASFKAQVYEDVGTRINTQFCASLKTKH